MKQFISSVFPDKTGNINLSGKDFHYLVEVRRETEGTVIQVRLPDGNLFPFKIGRIDRDKKNVCLSKEASSPEDSAADNANMFPRIILFQWILKSHGMDLVIRQAVETGVEAVIPVAGENCVPSVKPEERNSRWERIVREARQQSGSPVASRIQPAVSPSGIPELLGALQPEETLKLMLSEIPGESGTIHESIGGFCKKNGGIKTVVLAVGPEGGMSRKEAGDLISAGFEKIHFNTNVLRAETAALYGLAAVQNSMMEISKWQLKE